jgi:hypothetical protein
MKIEEGCHELYHEIQNIPRVHREGRSAQAVMGAGDRSRTRLGMNMSSRPPKKTELYYNISYIVK